MKLSPFILLLFVLCSCSARNERLKFCRDYTQSFHDTPPYFFWQGPAAANGQAVLRKIRSGDAQSLTSARALIGSPVVFIAEGAELRHGIFSDLQTRDGIRIEVDIVPFRDVHPTNCGSWTAEVKGTLESVDFEKRLIRISTKPENWKVAVQY